MKGNKKSYVFQSLNELPVGNKASSTLRYMWASKKIVGGSVYEKKLNNMFTTLRIVIIYDVIVDSY